MNTQNLVEWQKYAPNGLVYPWWTHPFLDVLETWDLKDKTWLEFGGGRSTAWLRSKCKWVDTIEANAQWATSAAIECNENNLYNGIVYSAAPHDLPEGVQERKQEYFNLLPKDKDYDIISVDGIWRHECLQLAIDHFKDRGGILIADNWQQDFVWISEVSEELMKPYNMIRFYQPGHTNHEGKPWNTVYWVIPSA
jgi:hypothetical protein